jgi:diaminopimelate epimerase
MEIPFTKMHGAGNDFIVVDCRELIIMDPAEFAKIYCHRRFGIGADQVLLLYSSYKADFAMKIFNADGSEVEMCGNGIRCFAKYIWDRKLSDKSILEIETMSGIIRPEKAGELVRVDMGEPVFEPEKVPVNLSDGQRTVIDYTLKIKDREFKITCVSMGNPHALIFIDEDVRDFPVHEYGPEIERHAMFPKRTNVEFINVINKQELFMRVWERGSGETMACGTGASASGVAAMLKGLTEKKVTIHLMGGDLIIEWAENNRVYMTGPAEEVFEGIIKKAPEHKKEYRRHTRKDYMETLEFSLKGEGYPGRHKCLSHDMSSSGIGILSDEELSTGQVILFKDVSKLSGHKSAIVIWCSKTNGKYRAGLMFI